MPWTIHLSPAAGKQLSKLPRDQQAMLADSIDRMRNDPFQGDTKALRGKKWKGRYRKRVGRYRLIFILRHSDQVVEISQVLLRSERTYH